MAYLVHSEEDRAAMLAAIGVDAVGDLLTDIPPLLRAGGLTLPDGLSELETGAEMRRLASRNRVFEARRTFAGAGVYRRFIPAAVDAVISKPEFYTAYTPYQPEASQGTLQAIFEFQTLISELTGLAVANASLYDGATAVAEAAMMAVVQTGRHEVLVVPHLHPEYLEVLRCYGDGRGFGVRLGDSPGPETAAVIFQDPDFLGLLQEPETLVDAAHRAGALAVAVVDPIALGLLSTPGEYGADIAVGEGQQLGMPPSFGGPHVGFIACRQDLVRRLPGRLIGQAHDGAGRRGFVLTLTAREQHIRREKATSNICTNHSLCALAASVYMTYLGADGLQTVAEISFDRARYLHDRLLELPQFEPAFPDRAFGFEFPIRCKTWNKIGPALSEHGFLAGIPAATLFPDAPDLADVVTFCTTEVNDRLAIDELVATIAAIAEQTDADADADADVEVEA